MKKGIAIALALSMIMTLFSGCGGKTGGKEPSSSKTGGTETSVSSTASKETSVSKVETVVSSKPAQPAEGDAVLLLMEEYNTLTEAGEDQAAAAVQERLMKVLEKRAQNPQMIDALLDTDEILTPEAKAMLDGCRIAIASNTVPEKPEITKKGYDWGALE